MSDTNWIITKTDTEPKALEAANSVFTISNGYLALKGNLQENRRGRGPTTIVHGVFDEADMIKGIPPSSHERRYLDEREFDTPKPYPSVANLPDPLFTQIFINEREVAFQRGEVAGFEQQWDLRDGVYSYHYEITDADGRTTRIRMSRFADMARAHQVRMLYEVTPLNHSAHVEIRAGVDGTVRSNLMGDRQYEVMETRGDKAERFEMLARTQARGIAIHIAVANRLEGGSAPAERLVTEDRRIYGVLSADAREGETITLARVVVIGTSEDARHGASTDAGAEIESAAAVSFEDARRANAAWWQEAWNRVDVRIGGDDLAQRYLRFCIFHLMQAAPRHSDRLSVPCKLLTGEWYQGSVFYDTDLYIVPFYTFTQPDVARACLNYRWHGLEPGRDIARRLGYQGAKFAWQSGPYGEEVLAPWYRFVHTNIHINGDVCYTLMQYLGATGDCEWRRSKGVDILFESARFYASRAVRGEDGRYHLHDVSGPDEGHCESTDNYYTNYLAKKTLLWAADHVNRLSRGHAEEFAQITARLGLQPGEPARWVEVAEGLAFLYDPETKVYEQYDGYYGLLPIPEDFREQQTEWWFTVYPYQAIHQPDVVMAQTLFREETPPDVYRANIEYYRPRSMDFSSMSHVIHSIAAKETGDMNEAYRQFIITSGEDLDESLTGRGDTLDGLHGTATGGAWMAAVLGFGGLHVWESGMSINPRLPEGWTTLEFQVVLKGEVVRFHITPEALTLTLGAEVGAAIEATVCGRPMTLKSGEVYTVRLA